MAITKYLKDQLLESLYEDLNHNEDVQEQMSAPEFVGEFDTPFVNDFNMLVNLKGGTNSVITGLRIFIDKIVVSNTYEINSVKHSMFIIYNEKLEKLKFIEEHNTSGSFEDLLEVTEFKINKSGILFGLIKDKNDKINFFVFNDVLDFSSLLSDDQFKSELFFSTLFDVETEITDDPDNPGDVLDVTVGNSLFGNYDKIGYNQDLYDLDVYSFALWKDDGDLSYIFNIKFRVEIAQTNAIDADWQINENIELTAGTNIPSNFEGISTLDVMSGERNSINKIAHIGSIMFSTQKDAAAGTRTTNTYHLNSIKPIRTLLNVNSNDRYKHYNAVTSGGFIPNSGVLVTPKNTILNKKSFFDDWLSRLQKYIDQKPDDITYSGEILLNTEYSDGRDISISIDKITIDKMLKASVIEIKEYNTFTWDYSDFDKREMRGILNLIIDNETIEVFNQILPMSKQQNINENIRYYQSFIWSSTMNAWLSNANSGANLMYEEYKMAANITEQIIVKVDNIEMVVGANTTAMISIEKEDEKDENIYTIVISENNAYEGTEPVMISTTRAFIPIKAPHESDNTIFEYGIFEFDSQAKNKKQIIERVYKKNEKSSVSNGVYTANLLDPVKIINVLINGLKVDTTDEYWGSASLNWGRDWTAIAQKTVSFPFSVRFNDTTANGITQTHLVTIKGADIEYGVNSSDDQVRYNSKNNSLERRIMASVSGIYPVSMEIHKTNDGIIDFRPDENLVFVNNVEENDIIEIKYTSRVDAPKKITLKNAPKGHDIFIDGVNDLPELGSTTYSILGVADNSNNPTTPQDIYGFNLYRSASNIDYDNIAEVETPSTMKLRHARSYRQKDLLFLLGFNEDFSRVARWTQIYPNSFNPYTHIPYENKNKLFNISRININEEELDANGNQLIKKGSVFDRDFSNKPLSENVLISTTFAEKTDMNDKPNDNLIIFGETNHDLFKVKKHIEKNPIERKQINFSLKTSYIDELDGKNVVNRDISNQLASLFKYSNIDGYKNLRIDKLIISYVGGDEVQEEATKFSKINFIDGKIEYRIALHKTSDKIIDNLLLINENGKVFATLDLSGHRECLDDGNTLEIYFEILIDDVNN